MGEEEPVEEPQEDELGELEDRKQQQQRRRQKRAKGLSFVAEEVLDKFKKVSQLKFSLWP